MRKFIISDIHGFGNVYYSIMNYLDNLSNEEEIELYINGDLIDRGYESAEILLDLIKRIKDNKYKIVYLGGNHELMMYELFEKKKKKRHISAFEDWYNNGGYITEDGLSELLKDDDKIMEVVNFVSNLKIYHKFKEKIVGKEIVLVHAACPNVIKDECDIFIKDNNQDIFNAVWTRENNIYYFLGHPIVDPSENKIGDDSYFTIIGHTPVSDKYGFEYNKKQNYLNIDGGCAGFVSGRFDYDHFPLVEVKDNYLKILTFNSKNEIIYGSYFNGKIRIPYTIDELSEARKYLNHKVKVKKLYLNEDGVVCYKK